jgi:phage tail-like protein
MTEQTKSRYLEHLPAIHHEDPFLGRFLLPFEQVFAGFEDLLSAIDRHFAPALAEPDFLPWLATWVALVLDESWDDSQRRRLIAEAVELYRWRGTVYGLKRYLEIYLGIKPRIRERRWPGGMQIGVASRIGGTRTDVDYRDQTEDRIIKRMERRQPVYRDYYVVETVAPAGHTRVPEGEPLRLYYRAGRVKSVEVGTEGEAQFVNIQLLDGEHRHHEPATVTRRDGLIDDRYTLTLEIRRETRTVEYRGDTFLIDEVERPYHFTLDIQTSSPEDWEKMRQPDSVRAVRAIIDLEKPAHTVYYLRLPRMISDDALQPIQMGVHSTIGLDMTMG